MEQVRMAPIDTVVVRRRQDAFPYFVISLASAVADHPRRDGRCSICRCAASWLSLLARAVAVPRRCARHSGCSSRRIADTQQVAFQVGAAGVVPADADAVGLHLSDLQHAARRCSSSRTIVPARYFLIALRGIVLKGAGARRRSGRSWWRCAVYAVVDAGAGVGAPARGSGADMRRVALSRLEGAAGAAARTRACSASSSSRRSCSCSMLGYAATTDVRDVPVVVADGDRSPASRELIARFDASPNFTDRRRRRRVRTTSIRTWSAGARGWRWRFRRATATALRRGRPQTRAGRRRRQRRELDRRRARLRDQPRRAATRRSCGAARPLARRHAAAGGIEPRVRVWFNPRLESRDFMMPGVARAAAARDHDQPVVDGRSCARRSSARSSS